MKLFFLLSMVGILSCYTGTAGNPWYTQGDFAPTQRMEYTITNPLNRAVTHASVIIRRDNFPLPDLHEMVITIVDPAGEPRPEPTDSVLNVQGGHQLRAETNGRMLFHQLDDLDKDGIWDELFFQIDLKANESKTIYIYIGENIRGWNKHHTHANIGSYCRHIMPFWETEEVGWKIWFANSVDAYGKRKPALVSPILYGENVDGYGIANINHDYGSDIQEVGASFGASAICLFEFPDKPDVVSMPRKTPVKQQLAPNSLWNAGQISDTRYAYDVVVNGPIRSMVKIKAMNWDSGNGIYEYEQFYTAYAHHNYCISKVCFTVFQPKQQGVLMGCGMRKKPQEDNFVQKGGFFIASGPEEVRDPQKIDKRDNIVVDFIGGAIVVKDCYKPQYRYISAYAGNHVFCVTPDENHSYEYMVCTAWSEGSKLTNKTDFNKYVALMAEEFNKPMLHSFVKTESKPSGLSYEELRLSQKVRITGGDADLTDSVVVQRIAVMDKNVSLFWKSMNKSSARKYLWNDAECRDDTVSPFRPASVTTPIGRLSGMATAYATKGSAFYQDRALKKDIIDGMEWMYKNKWSPQYPMYGNWWDWIIGMPGSVNSLLTVMYDDFTPEQRTRYIEALDYYAPGVTFEGASTGANKIWQCSSMILRGILSHNDDKIQMGVDGIDSEFKFVTTHDGFYKDGSFLQHQWHPYTGGYGASFLRDIVYLMAMVHGSKWEISASHKDMLCEWLENAYLPLIYKGAMMDMVRGREIARQAVCDRYTGHSILLNAYNISKMADEDVKKRLQSRIKYEILSDTWRDFITQDAPVWQLAELRSFLRDEQIPAQAPAAYHHQFSVMDRVVHVRPAFAVGLAMSSDRIENYESIDSENMRAWHTADGMTYLYNGDQAQYTDHFWSTVDYYRLPGITVDAQQQHEVKSLVFGKGILYADGYKSPQTWVGGASIEQSCGISGMWFADEKSTLQAKKTWFMVGDEIAALGAGINSADHHTIETIIDNRKISGIPHIVVEDATTLQDYGTLTPDDVSWVHFSTSTPGTEMGYYFPIRTGIQIQKSSRTGSWRDISKYGDPTPVTRDYFTLWFDHGKNPSNATYEYVLLPGKTAAEVKSYASTPNMEIITNTPQVQAIKAKKESVTSWNFWDTPASPVAGLTVSAPASVILRETETELIIGISDPTQKGKTITVELNRHVSGISVAHPDIKLLSLAPLRLLVNVNGSLGATRSIVFNN